MYFHTLVFFHSHRGPYSQHLIHSLKCSWLLSSIMSDDEPDNGIALSQSYAFKYLAGSKFHYFNLPLTIIWTLSIHSGSSTKLHYLAVACMKSFFQYPQTINSFLIKDFVLKFLFHVVKFYFLALLSIQMLCHLPLFFI